MQSKEILKKYKNGFTLIEIMVAVSIFAMVMVVGIGAVLSIVSANKRAQAYNSVITNLSFALEGMMRDLRTGYNYDCQLLEPIGTVTSDCIVNGEAMSPSHAIGFKSSQYNAAVIYGLDKTNPAKGFIYKQVGGTSAPKDHITSDDVNIDRLDFYVVDTDKPDVNKLQPRILIVISGKYGGYGQGARFDMQTTVSQRKLDIPD